jgi:hypothetical protein
MCWRTGASTLTEDHRVAALRVWAFGLGHGNLLAAASCLCRAAHLDGKNGPP